MRSIFRKGFSLYEVLVAICILSMIAVFAVRFYIASYTSFAHATVDGHSLAMLNEALEDYKLYGGMAVGDTLGGPNTSSKISHVLASLRSGVTIQGKRASFLNSGTYVNTAGIVGSGLGSNFIFVAYDSRTAQAVLPSLQFSGNMNFGMVQINTASTATLTITNTGGITITGLFISGIPSGYSAGSLSASSLTPGQSATTTITFNPTANSLYNGALTVNYTANSIASTSTVGLAGTGGSSIISLNTLAFGTIPSGANSTAILAIQNTGTAPLTVNSISYPSGYSGPWNGVVPAGSSQYVTVTFSPTSVATYNNTITVNASATSGTNTTSVTGAGGQSGINVAGSLSFGTVVVGSSSTGTMTITNTGSTTLTVSSITLPNSAYTLSWDSGAIAAGSSQTVTVTFAPISAINYGGTITVNSNSASGTNTIAVTGTGGTPTIALSGSMSFGTVLVSSTSTATLTITNNGSAPISISNISLPAGFSANWTTGTVAGSGGTKNITITFAPTQVQTYGGILEVSSNAVSGTSTIAISGTGSRPTIALIGSLAFGTVTVGSYGQASMTITNNGNAALTVNSITFPSTVYNGNWTSGTVAANGGTQDVTITFTPYAGQSYNGTITVNCASPCSGTNTISVTGTGAIDGSGSGSGSSTDSGSGSGSGS